jgi:hypothetical protein
MVVKLAIDRWRQGGVKLTSAAEVVAYAQKEGSNLQTITNRGSSLTSKRRAHLLNMMSISKQTRPNSKMLGRVRIGPGIQKAYSFVVAQETGNDYKTFMVQRSCLECKGEYSTCMHQPRDSSPLHINMPSPETPLQDLVMTGKVIDEEDEDEEDEKKQGKKNKLSAPAADANVEKPKKHKVKGSKSKKKKEKEKLKDNDKDIDHMELDLEKEGLSSTASSSSSTSSLPSSTA